MDSLIRKVVSAKDINHKGQGLWVSMKILMGDLKQVYIFECVKFFTIIAWMLMSYLSLFKLYKQIKF